MNTRHAFATAMWTAAVMVACGRQPDQGSLTAATVTHPTGATVTRPIDADGYDPAAIERASREGGEPVASAVRQIASTFCDHEQACDNVGPQRSYATRSECLDRQARARSVALRSTACVSRLPKATVAHCMDILRGTACVLADDGASRVAECRAGALCSGG
jgi:hypothetical protein